MENPTLDKKILYRLSEFVQDFLNAKDDFGRNLADSAAYEYVDTVFNEDIGLRANYTDYYENQKKIGKR